PCAGASRRDRSNRGKRDLPSASRHGQRFCVHQPERRNRRRKCNCRSKLIRAISSINYRGIFSDYRRRSAELRQCGFNQNPRDQAAVARATRRERVARFQITKMWERPQRRESEPDWRIRDTKVPPTLPTTRRRDAARILLARLAFLPVSDRIPSTRYERRLACRRARKRVLRRSLVTLATS